ncbi:hypothetical protein [Amycolatopsis sp. lyj-23]|uniref:hypothetical protein n=1 Tax=Amycolatopsis sp. lyj-23 TaxID=2789283 RepID=UPI00397932C5
MGRTEFANNPNRPWADVPHVREDLRILLTLLTAPQQALLLRLTRPGWHPISPDQAYAATVINWWTDTFWFADPLILCRDGKAVMAISARPIVAAVVRACPAVPPAHPQVERLPVPVPRRHPAGMAHPARGSRQPGHGIARVTSVAGLA